MKIGLGLCSRRLFEEHEERLCEGGESQGFIFKKHPA